MYSKKSYKTHIICVHLTYPVHVTTDIMTAIQMGSSGGLHKMASRKPYV